MYAFYALLYSEIERKVWEIEGKTCSKGRRAQFKPVSLCSWLRWYDLYPVSHRGALYYSLSKKNFSFTIDTKEKKVWNYLINNNND